MVTNTLQHSISKMRLGTARVGMIFAVVIALVMAQLAQGQTFTVLHNFTGYPNDGAYPEARLLFDAAGNLYGTTEGGGASGNGTVFKLSKTGHETVLYTFAGGTDGSVPAGGLVPDQAGNLYGTTS